MDKTPLEEAQEIVHNSHRGEAYGRPIDVFSITAKLWSALFGWSVEPQDVAQAMICYKQARLQQSPRHRDSVVDIAGYDELYWMTLNDTSS